VVLRRTLSEYGYERRRLVLFMRPQQWKEVERLSHGLNGSVPQAVEEILVRWVEQTSNKARTSGNPGVPAREPAYEIGDTNV